MLSPYKRAAQMAGRNKVVNSAFIKTLKDFARLISRYDPRVKSLRQATVEALLGTLINFLGLRKINSRGTPQAHKVMLLAATAYNLKKLLNFKPKNRQSALMALPRPFVPAFFDLFCQRKVEKYWIITSN